LDHIHFLVRIVAPKKHIAPANRRIETPYSTGESSHRRVVAPAHRKKGDFHHDAYYGA
jgi:hypothetical protein